jgi:hypothetical protein
VRLDPHVVLGRIEVGDDLEFQDHLWGNSPSVRYTLLYFCKVPGKGTHVCASVLGVRVSPQ